MADCSRRGRTVHHLVLVCCVITGAAAPVAGQVRRVTVDIDSKHQTIEGWGASMIFWDLANTPYQQPAWRRAYRDLGLNILRINIAKEVLRDRSGDLRVPVHLESSVASNIAKMSFSNEKTRVFAEMARWLRKNALEPDRVKITGSVWSPPHWMKGPTGFTQFHVTAPTTKKKTPWLSEGNSGDSIGGRLLQTPDNLEQFGRYLVAWIRGFEDHFGIPIYGLSIQNEVSFENPFDSTTYAKGADGRESQWWQYAAALKAVKDEFRGHGVQTRIMGPHVAHVGQTPSNPWGLLHQTSYIAAVKAHPDAELIDFVWSYNCNGYLDVDEAAVKMWAAYYRGKDAVPGNWARWAKAPGVAADGKPTWVSEAGGEMGTWLAGPNHTPGKGAITVAQKIHNALVHANVSAYLYWLLSDNNDLETGETLLGKRHVAEPMASKKYSAFKHFSRYIRPGATRIGATFANGTSSAGGSSPYDTLHGLNVSAFLHDTDHELTMIFVNMRPSVERVRVAFPKVIGIKQLFAYVTTEDESFASRGAIRVVDEEAALTVPPYAVVTLHGRTAAATATGPGSAQ